MNNGRQTTNNGNKITVFIDTSVLDFMDGTNPKVEAAIKEKLVNICVRAGGNVSFVFTANESRREVNESQPPFFISEKVGYFVAGLMPTIKYYGGKDNTKLTTGRVEDGPTVWYLSGDKAIGDFFGDAGTYCQISDIGEFNNAIDKIPLRVAPITSTQNISPTVVSSVVSFSTYPNAPSSILTSTATPFPSSQTTSSPSSTTPKPTEAVQYFPPRTLPSLGTLTQERAQGQNGGSASSPSKFSQTLFPILTPSVQLVLPPKTAAVPPSSAPTSKSQLPSTFLTLQPLSQANANQPQIVETKDVDPQTLQSTQQSSTSSVSTTSTSTSNCGDRALAQTNTFPKEEDVVIVVQDGPPGLYRIFGQDETNIKIPGEKGRPGRSVEMGQKFLQAINGLHERSKPLLAKEAVGIYKKTVVHRERLYSEIYKMYTEQGADKCKANKEFILKIAKAHVLNRVIAIMDAANKPDDFKDIYAKIVDEEMFPMMSGATKLRYVYNRVAMRMEVEPEDKNEPTATDNRTIRQIQVTGCDVLAGINSKTKEVLVLIQNFGEKCQKGLKPDAEAKQQPSQFGQ